MTNPPPAKPVLPTILAIGGWVALVSGSAVIEVPFVALLSVVLVPAGALALTIAGLWPAAPTASRTRLWLGGLISSAGTLFLAGLTAYVAMNGAWTVLAWQRSAFPAPGVGVWALMIGLNVLGVAVTEAGNRQRLAARAKRPLVWLMGLAPVAGLLALLLVSRFFPFSA